MTRARAALAILAALALTALSADLLASSLPLAARVHGQLYLAPCLTRPTALRDEDNASLRAQLQPGDWLIATPVPYGPEAQHPGGESRLLESPSARHWLGTDEAGRDVLARLLHGTRVALSVGPLAVSLYLLFGALVGLLAASGPRADLALGRLTEVALTFPTFFLLLAVQGFTARSSLFEVGLALAFTSWPEVARLVRAEALKLMQSPHVEAARALGASRTRIALVHVVPLALGPALVAAAFGLGRAVLLESALSFLGFGVAPPTATWGELLAEAQSSGLKPWLLVPPTLAIALVVVTSNLLGDALARRLESRAD
jgi:peptide/nickel transport system permease protein